MPKTQYKRTHNPSLKMTSSKTKFQLPEMPSAPGKQDKACQIIFVSVLVIGLSLCIASFIYNCNLISQGAYHKPTDWWTLSLGMIFTILTAFMLRAVVWLAFAGTTMLAGQISAFHAQEQICKLALRLRKLMPDGAIWAVHGLMGQMLNRGQFKELIALGNAEYEVAQKRKKANDQTLAPLCYFMGLANQIQGDAHSSILWNERAVELFNKVLEPLSKAKKNKKLPSQDMMEGMILQYAHSYANLGAAYMNVGNYGKAKKNFQLSLEELAKCKDNSQKEALTKGIHEHLSRLKHW